MKSLLAVIIAVTLVFSLTSCKKEKPGRVITTQSPSINEDINNEATYTGGGSITDNQTSSKESGFTKNEQTDKVTRYESKTEGQTKPKPNSNQYGSYVTAEPVDTNANTKYERKGIVAFSDSADNKYIKLISEKYGVDASLLAAIFTIPYEGMEDEANGNTVLRFDGSRDSKGKLIRTEDTLTAIYTIDAKDNCKWMSVDVSEKDDFNYFEKKAIIYAVTEKIMPTFQKELY